VRRIIVTGVTRMAEINLNCPLPLPYEQIVMAHGGGGRLMQQLLDRLIQPVFDNPILAQKQDSAVITVNSAKLAFTTDSYVIKPLFFPGGDIGKLAVCGTLNDLAMSGAKPLYLSCSLIIEEGFPLADLKRILQSMQQSAQKAGVKIVTGDTKVVEQGKGDGLYINTAGIGIIESALAISPQKIHSGDSIIINGDIARHGIAIMLERESMQFDHHITSDCSDLSGIVHGLLDSGVQAHCMRDLTRGGLASVLLELASAADCHLEIDETAVPIHEAVSSACEILGFDPLYVANEGCFVLFVPEHQTYQALEILRLDPLGQQAAVIGKVIRPKPGGMVTVKTSFGTSRVLNLLSGEQLPRIC